jgi:hypothetical protein
MDVLQHREILSDGLLFFRSALRTVSIPTTRSSGTGQDLLKSKPFFEGPNGHPHGAL